MYKIKFQIMKNKFTSNAILMLIFCQSFNLLNAQTTSQIITATILEKDSIFWTAYNNCDIDDMMQFMADDVEFYHDKGGLIIGKDNLRTNLSVGLCGNQNSKLRREVVKESVAVFTLKNADNIYGAIISGTHVFYVIEPGKKEWLDGMAKFTHLWLLNNSSWKMSRILSYDHGPVSFKNTRKEVQLSSLILEAYCGKYNSVQNGIITIQRVDNALALLLGDQKLILYPETDNVFFVKERDLTFEFVKDKNNNIIQMIIREKGDIVEKVFSY